MLKKYTREELDKILKDHAVWLIDNSKGKRADFRHADLKNTDLSYTDLRYTDLSYVNLSYTDLRFADLRFADLRFADLRFADLRNSNLSYTDLSSADLRNANLGFNCNLSSAITDFKFIQVAGIGSQNRSTLYIFDTDKIFCGCFKGNLEEFEKQVKSTYKSGIYLDQYTGAINYIKYLKNCYALENKECWNYGV